jgi:hypothetical protein
MRTADTPTKIQIVQETMNTRPPLVEAVRSSGRLMYGINDNFFPSFGAIVCNDPVILSTRNPLPGLYLHGEFGTTELEVVKS